MLENDYYLYMNYDLHRKSIEAPDAEVSHAAVVSQRVRDAVWHLINTGGSPEARFLRILTSLIMDGGRREKEGLEPLLSYVRRVRETKTVEELSALCREEGFLFGAPCAQCQLERSGSLHDPGGDCRSGKAG